MRSLSLLSPAKLNLFLKVLNKRSDGYHNLITLFERIDLCDEIRFKDNSLGRIRIFCDHPDVPLSKKNLVYKAAVLLREDFGLANGVDIHLKKRIPVAAGLAGGSSNAATTLMGLNRLWHLGLSRAELVEYAAKLGSDVAFFIHETPWAIGMSRGEVIKKIFLKTNLWHVLVVPKVKMYARDVFQAFSPQDPQIIPSPISGQNKLQLPVTRPGSQLYSGRRSALQPQNLKLTKKDDDVNILTRYLRLNRITEVSQRLFNDLETPILFLQPKLGQLKSKLQQSNRFGAAFSGSGPAIFGLTDSRKEAQRLFVLLKKQYRQVFVVRTFH